MIPTLLGLRTLIYDVADITAAKEWYAKALNVQPYFDTPFYVGFSIAGYEFGLHANNPGERLSEHIVGYWGVTEIQEMFDHLIQCGATEIGKVRDVGEGILVAELRDPFGNTIGLIHNPHFTKEHK